MVQNEILEFKIFNNSIDRSKASKGEKHPRENLASVWFLRKWSYERKQDFHSYVVSHLLLPNNKKKLQKIKKPKEKSPHQCQF